MTDPVGEDDVDDLSVKCPSGAVHYTRVVQVSHQDGEHRADCRQDGSGWCQLATWPAAVHPICTRAGFPLVVDAVARSPAADPSPAGRCAPPRACRRR